MVNSGCVQGQAINVAPAGEKLGDIDIMTAAERDGRGGGNPVRSADPWFRDDSVYDLPWCAKVGAGQAGPPVRGVLPPGATDCSRSLWLQPAFAYDRELAQKAVEPASIVRFAVGLSKTHQRCPFATKIVRRRAMEQPLLSASRRHVRHSISCRVSSTFAASRHIGSRELPDEPVAHRPFGIVAVQINLVASHVEAANVPENEVAVPRPWAAFLISGRLAAGHIYVHYLARHMLASTNGEEVL